MAGRAAAGAEAGAEPRASIPFAFGRGALQEPSAGAPH